MDLFHVETGTIPGQSCNEEKMPILKRNSRKDEPATCTSKAFLINDSLNYITNLTFTFADPSNNVEGCHIKHTSPVKQRDSKTEAPKSPEYCYLSPQNLEGPIYPCVESNIEVKASDSKKQSLLEKNTSVLKDRKSDQLLRSKRLLKDENELKQSSTILALAASQPDQPSTSSAYPSGNSPADPGKKKTLGELAKEWNTIKNPIKTKAEGKKVNKDIVDNAESEEALVRHSTYYSTSSIHGMSNQECRLRNKLKTRRHLNRDEVYHEKKTDSPLLAKLHAVATE